MEGFLGLGSQRGGIRAHARGWPWWHSFVFSSKNFGNLDKGLVKDTHHPVDDAKGNAEALLTMKEQMGLKIRL